MRAFWNYYIPVNTVNICFSLVVALFSAKPLLFSVLFCSAGIAVGILAFNYFYNNQYYFYHNLGYTRRKLAGMVVAINLVPGLVLFLLIKSFT